MRARASGATTISVIAAATANQNAHACSRPRNLGSGDSMRRTYPPRRQSKFQPVALPGMERTMGARRQLISLVVVVASLGAPAAAHADASWSCSAGAGWTAANGQRSEAPAIGGSPCPNAQAAPGGTTGLAATGTVAVDGGGAAQTTDTKRPEASIDAKTVSIRNADGKFALDVWGLTSKADGSCDANRQPAFTSAGSPGKVTLNGRPIDTSREYTEPGLGVNGAPLFGKITIRFDEVAKSDAGISRREVHVIVTDRGGAIVFEAAAGEVAVGRDGPVCDPPPICPPGQEPQAGRCVDVSVAPLPTPPAPTRARRGVPPPASSPPRRAGSRKRTVPATICLMNLERQRH